MSKGTGKEVKLISLPFQLIKDLAHEAGMGLRAFRKHAEADGRKYVAERPRRTKGRLTRKGMERALKQMEHISESRH